MPLTPRASRVLLVDPCVDTLDMYAVGLASAGFLPVIASDSSSARQYLCDERLAAVVAEVRVFEQAEGQQFLQQLTHRVDGHRVPLIALTTYRDGAIQAWAQRIDGVVLLSKPCLPSELAETLSSVLMPGARHA